MLSTPHVIVGIAIAKAFPDPTIAIPLAFCSHFVLEMIPHWNPHLNTEIRKYGRLTNKTIGIIILDTTLALASSLFLSFNLSSDYFSRITMLLAALAAIAPDLFEIPYFFFHIKNGLLSWWLRIQKSIQSDANPIFGLSTQALTIVLFLVWLLKF